MCIMLQNPDEGRKDGVREMVGVVLCNLNQQSRKGNCSFKNRVFFSIIVFYLRLNIQKKSYNLNSMITDDLRISNMRDRNWIAREW